MLWDGVDDARYCIITGIQCKKASIFRVAVELSVKRPLAHHGGTSQTPAQPQSEPRVVTPTPPVPPQYETASWESHPDRRQLRTECTRTQASRDLPRRTTILHTCYAPERVRRSSKFARQISSVVIGLDEVVKHKVKLSSRSESKSCVVAEFLGSLTLREVDQAAQYDYHDLIKFKEENWSPSVSDIDWAKEHEGLVASSGVICMFAGSGKNVSAGSNVASDKVQSKVEAAWQIKATLSSAGLAEN